MRAPCGARWSIFGTAVSRRSPAVEAVHAAGDNAPGVQRPCIMHCSKEGVGMSSADRLSKLMDAWLTSLELHLQYTQLSDLAYSCVQPWPQHDRPTRLVVQIAREKVLQLKQHCDARRAAGDEQF